MKKNKNDSIVMVLFSAMLGVIIFIMIYGVSIINPSNDAWLLSTGGDLTCPYLGWVKYRETEWRFPIGLIKGILEPEYACITYTDSIPLLAIFFKVIDMIVGLPEIFQYWGIWGVICFALGGVFGSLIIYEQTKSRVYGILGSLFFILSPLVLYRMYMHTALAGQWIILATIYLFLKKEMKPGKKAVLYSVACILAAYVHIYFIPMIVIILFADILRLVLCKRIKFLRGIGMFLIPIVSTLFFMWILGCFYQKGGEVSDAGLGYHSFNINGFINSTVIDQWWFGSKTKIFPGLPQIFGQYEGFAYLGAGVLLICIVCFPFFINKGVGELDKAELISLMFIFFCCAFFALSPTVSIGEKVLFVIPWPERIVKFLSIFRASGRLIWPAYYLVVIYAICALFNLIKDRKKTYIAMLVAMGIQIYDFSGILQAINQWYTQSFVYSSALKASCWKEELKEYEHVMFLGYQTYDNNIGVWAAKNGIGMNDFYMARKNEDKIQAEKSRQLENIRGNTEIDKTIYVFSQEANVWREASNLNYYLVDGYVIGIKGVLNGEDVTALIQKDSVEVWLSQNQFLSNGMDTEQGRVIYYGGVSIGPFIYLDEGEYEIVIEGKQFESATSDIFSFEIYNNTQSGIPFELSRNGDCMKIKFAVEQPIDDFQVRVYNIGDEGSEVVINKITIYKDRIL